MHLSRQFWKFRRWLPMVILGGLVTGVLAFLNISAQPRVYEATATLRLGQALSGSPILLVPVSDRLLTELAYRGTSRAMLEEVNAELGLEATPSDLKRDVDVEVPPDSALLVVVARAHEPELAARLAQAVADKLLSIGEAAQGDRTIQRALRNDLETIRSQIDGMRARIDALNATAPRTPAQVTELASLEGELVGLIGAHGSVLDRLLSLGAYALDYVEQGAAAETPIEPRPTLFAALAAAATTILLAGLAVVVTYFDETIREAEDLADAAGIPVLASLTEFRRDAIIGRDSRLITLSQPRSETAEAYRHLRATLEVAAKDRPLRTLLVSGSTPSIGKSVVAANLAVVFAESGRRVLLVDADFREPSVHGLFRMPPHLGLSDFLARDSFSRAGHPVARTRVPNLDVIPSGASPPNPSEALASQRMRGLIADLSSHYQLVVVVGPPLPQVSDSVVLAALLGWTLLVVGQGRTRRSDVRHALDALDVPRAQVLGAVLVRQRRGSHPIDRGLPDRHSAPQRTEETPPARASARSD